MRKYAQLESEMDEGEHVRRRIAQMTAGAERHIGKASVTEQVFELRGYGE